MKYSFKKEEKLSSKKLTQELFSKGSSFYSYPFVIRFLQSPVENQNQHALLISVSKRNFKHAVTRNVIKRRVREAYRLNKHLLKPLIEKGQILNIGLVFTAKKELNFDLIENKLNLVLKRLIKEAE